MATWTDLDRDIRATNAINPTIVHALATQSAEKEMRVWRDMGMPRPWAVHFREAMITVWCRARTILDNHKATLQRARLPASEQLARTAELNADLAEHAIPPRPAEARKWREEAAACRRAKFRVVS